MEKGFQLMKINMSKIECLNSTIVHCVTLCYLRESKSPKAIAIDVANFTTLSGNQHCHYQSTAEVTELVFFLCVFSNGILDLGSRHICPKRA